jgi:quinol monooxygenase YgiN
MKKLRCVRIEYTIRPEVGLDEVKAAITQFVDGIRAHDEGNRYTSYQLADDERRFVHVGEFAEDVVGTLQEQTFFRQFSSFLRERCAEGPTVTTLARVASAR